MPRYVYRCPSCIDEFEVIKRFSEADEVSICPFCDENCKPEHRIIFPPAGLINTGVENPEYDPGLGMVINSKKHRQEIIKARGLEEVGNEPPEKIQKHFDDQLEQKRKDSYKKFLAPIEVNSR